jgi:hypothetical protein
MTLTAEFLACHDGQPAFHMCRTRGLRDRILSEGLRPAAPETANFARDLPELSSRPGHVYLTVSQVLFHVARQTGPLRSGPPGLTDLARLAELVIAVDLRGLDQQAFSPDEDCCFLSTLILSTLTSEAGVAPLPAPGARSPDDLVRDPWADSSVEQLHENPDDYAVRPYASYGEWAEGEGVGNDPQHTAACWLAISSLCYRGLIDAQRLTPARVEQKFYGEASELSAGRGLGSDTGRIRMTRRSS